MAEMLLSAFLPVVFEKLSSEGLKIVTGSKEIHSQLKKWETSLKQIQALLNDASQREVTDESVKGWLNRLQHLAYDVDDLLDDLATEDMSKSTSKVRNLTPDFITSFSLSRRMRGKLDDITTRLQELKDETNTLGLIVKVGRSKSINTRGDQTSLVDASSIVGRQHDKEALLQKLLGDTESCDENFSIVPIVGMGGIGKTTMARILYDEVQVNDHFQVKAWVCVSNDFNVFKITNLIFQSIDGDQQKNFVDLNKLQIELKKKLSNKRFLVVLDDVWSESYVDWELLARPFLAGAPGSKVVITTRKLTLLTRLGYDQPHRISTMSHEDALSLFAKHALGASNFDSHPTLRDCGEGVVKKCDGLPLALIAVGRLLRTTVDKEEWKEVLDNEIWSLPNRDEITPALRLSYQDLSAPLKRLFVYCSLFPKGYIFDKKELILFWMAEGFLHQTSSVNRSPERVGHEYFEELFSKLFFQHAPDNESLYVMHDLMHDLATSVAGNFFIRLENEMERHVTRELALEKYRHMSFIREEFGGYDKFKVFERAKSLRTFLAVSIGDIESEKTFYLSNKVLVDLIPKYPMLRVLHLSRFEISVVPDSIGTLKHLRYLNLSQTRISYLPESIGSLYNLQSLLVCDCERLTKLPKDISKLKNLRHLDISETPLLEKLPSGIGELKSLQTLSKVIIEGANGFEITELKKLKDLQGKLVIMGLDRVKDALDAKNANIFDKELDYLELGWSDVFDGARNEINEQRVLDALKPHNDKLITLVIYSYGGLMFPGWVGDPSFLRLSEVTISGCKKCKSLPPLGQLPLLKNLFIRDMDELQVIGLENNFCGGTVAFPSLELLTFTNMQGWKEWSTKNEDTTRKAFPCLHTLYIQGCPNLVQVSLESLSTLRTLYVIGCGEGVLRSVVQAAPMLTALQMEDILGMAQLHGGVMEYLGAVRHIDILGCNEMRYLWESEAVASKYLVKLETLIVCDCKSIVSFGGKEDGFLTSLRFVSIENCASLEHYNCPKHVKMLWIDGCGGLTSISFPKGAEEIEVLDVRNCQKLQEEELGGGSKTASMLTNTSVQTLEALHISDHPNLKSVIGLSCFIHLTHLSIVRCENLESFPDHELSHLTSLTHLAIFSCPNIDESFPRGLWPPKLRVLRIGGLKKRISEWGKQNFPTSLVSLMLIGGSLDDVGSDGSKLCHLLPSSLTRLYITGFYKLKSLSKQHQDLPSLQHLLISFCPKMRSLRLDQTLVASLLELCIGDCPLQKKCSRKGKGSFSYWHRISHIPCIRLEDDEKILLIPDDQS